MYKQISILIVFSFQIVFCGGNYGNLSAQNTAAKNQKEKVPQNSQVNEGKSVYMKYCFACHQTDGSGVPGMYPAIRKTSWVSGDKNRLIKLVLEGLKEPIIVNDEEYNQAMPKHDFLTNRQIADVLTYIRKNFGNNASAVSELEVSKVRVKK